MKKATACLIIICAVSACFLSSCKKKENFNAPKTSGIIAVKETASEISKKNDNGEYTFTFDPAVLPDEVKNILGDTKYYTDFVNAVMEERSSVSMPSRNYYDCVRFALGENFPFSSLIKKFTFDSTNNVVMISYVGTDTKDKAEEFKKAVSGVFDECVKASDNDVLSAMSIYRWLGENIKIGQETHNAESSDVSSSQSEETRGGNSIFSTLISKSGTDSSVAALYNFLLRQLGINCKSISARNEKNVYRTWNLVKLNSRWYNCDILEEQKKTHGVGLKFFGMTQESTGSYIVSEKFFTGAYSWFTDSIPRSASNKFKDFRKVIKWETESSRKSITAYTDEASKFIRNV